MKPSRPKPAKEFQIPIYGGVVLLFKTRRAYENAVQFIANSEIDTRGSCGICTGLQDKEGRSLYLIGWFDKTRSTLVHESGHLALNVLERAGMDPQDSGGEALCYLLGYITREFGIDK